MQQKNRDINFITYGGKITLGSVQNFLKNGYSKKKSDSIDGYQIDKELSGNRCQVYHNPTDNKTVVNHKGTDSLQDWMTNLRYGLFNDKSGKRFQHSKNLQQQAENKYKGSEITTVGHSLGSKLAQEAVKHTKSKGDVVTVNGATTPYDIGKKVPSNQTNIRTSSDAVSYLQKYQKKNGNEINIPSSLANILKEHSTDTMNRLDPNREVGSGLLKTHHNKMLKAMH